MRKLILATVLLISSLQPVFAQYADLGTGVLKNQIWWFNWAGFTVAEGASRTFTTTDGLTVRVDFSNVTPHVPIPYVMDTYVGALLYLLYNFSDPTIMPALFDVTSTQNFAYTLTITATRNGVPVPFSIVTSDAESSQLGETTTLQTNGGNWQTIQFYRNSSQTVDPLTGCGTQTAAFSNTYGGDPLNPTQLGQCAVISTEAPVTGPLILQTTSDHAGTNGGMALAFGIFDPVDRGDLPAATYGTAQHQVLYSAANPCAYNPPFPVLNQTQTLKIGLVPGDPDPIQYTDDNAIGVDEEGVSAFPVYDGSGSYSVNVTLGNTTGSNAYLTGWFDFNRDGTFETGESVTATIPNNATSTVLTWTGLPQYLPQGAASGYGFRFRISSDLQATQSATGYAPDGEVEDYFVPSVSLCTPLILSVTPDQLICAGKSAPLQASGGVTYAWSPSAGLTDPSIPNPVASPSLTTLYTVTASTPQGCSATSPITVSIDPVPVITVSGQTLLCKGSPATLIAAGGISYSWTAAGQSFNASGPSITVTPGDSTKYYVTGSGSNGCTASDSINVAVPPLPIFTANAKSSSICRNDSVVLLASGGDQYAWLSGTGQPLGATPSIIVSPDVSNDYQVQITNNLCQLTQTLTVPVTVRDLPDIGITSSNDINCTVGQATLRATGGISYQWANTSGITDLTAADPVVRPTRTTTYYVKGTGSDGCSSIDSITEKVDFTSDMSHYPVPSAFSPNNDGNNDCFGLKNWPTASSIELSVYNRWGVRVFITTDPTGCWDGTFKGAPQPAGGYVYQIKANTPCGTAYRKGIVILVR
jgi:gliding motility-associated-like protein